MATEWFEHPPLRSASQSFRILDLLPSWTRNAPIHCSLREVEIGPDPMPQYEALSYVWHAKPGKGVIFCNGKALEVTTNCLDALKALRHRRKPRSLWVDAICIDQRENDTSTKERSSQISIMDYIYETAERVICWLGPSMKGIRRLAMVVEAIERLDFLCDGKTSADKALRPLCLQAQKTLICKSGDNSITLDQNSYRLSIPKTFFIEKCPIKYILQPVLESDVDFTRASPGARIAHIV